MHARVTGRLAQHGQGKQGGTVIQTPTVKEAIWCHSSQYRARLSAHPNDLIVNLIELPDNRPLRRHLPNDLPTTFLV
jgi:hypothetical protein